ncbi:hypothetical protein [Qaidamihabitans albus]|uniref:hypothetical protein n=1 Tax=Qaidamihabitans albus TaxID=2795733 RepID=UPI0018F1A0A2|nr:hypothetical protein [Qaidamihabitans albus]
MSPGVRRWGEDALPVRGGSDFMVGGRGAGALRVTTASMTTQQATSFAADLAAVL